MEEGEHHARAKVFSRRVLERGAVKKRKERLFGNFRLFRDRSKALPERGEVFRKLRGDSSVGEESAFPFEFRNESLCRRG